jgi:hypothetical protein
MNQRLTYRAELYACNLAIYTLNNARPIRSALQKGFQAIQNRELPIWASAIAASSLGGLLAGFCLYCLIGFGR